jgi:Tfp pilus assembly protein PilP
MRLAQTLKMVSKLAFLAALVPCAVAQEHPNVQPSTVRDQLNKAGAPPQTQQPPPQAPPAPAKSGSAPAKPTGRAASKATAPAKTSPAAKAPVAAKGTAGGAPAPAAQGKAPAKSAPSKSAAQAAKPAPSKAPSKAPAKAATKAPAKPPAQKAAVAKAAPEKAAVAKRDPFESLLNRATSNSATPENLPPGRAGLVVSTLSIDGLVRSPNGMIAVVSNPQHRVYFLREGDKLYDGSVDHITLEAISFHEIGKDAFGKAVEREVTKRLYATSGEQP